MPRVEVGGEDIFYVHQLAGSAEECVVFVHGAGGTHRHWGHQLRTLAGRNSYALDLPGHGRSGGQGRSSIADYTGLLSGFLEALGLTHATLVGHSMGGAIAQTLALTHSSAVDGLVLVATGARLRVLPSFLEGLLDDFESAVETGLAYAYSSNAPQGLMSLAREEWLANPPAVLHGDFLACDRFDVMGRLGDIRCPTLVICGEEDQLTPAKYSQFLVDRIADTRLAIIPGAGHMVMLEQPEAVSSAMAGFLGAAGE